VKGSLSRRSVEVRASGAVGLRWQAVCGCQHSSPCLFSGDAEQLDLEHQRRIRRDHAARAARAIREVRRNGELALAADFHAGDALVPASDHLPPAEAEFERIVAIDARVELLAVGEPAGVMQGDVVTRCGDRAVAADEVFDDQGAWGGVGSPRGLSESEFVASGFWGQIFMI
jgi:hypothetical protein